MDAVTRAVLLLIQPIGLLWLSLIVLTLALWWKRQRAFAAGATLILLFVQTIGGTNFSVLLLASLEQPHAGVKIEELPVCDAIVLLGGGVEPSPNEVANLHLTSASDRIMMALELARLGKAPVLCISGGTASLDRRRWVEADLIQQAIETRGLSRARVISFGACRDTHDEALHLRRLATENGWQRFLLVTSAVHQRRALATFRQQGLDVVPAPCNFLTTLSPEAEPPIFGIPTNLGFLFASTWLHEEIGWLEYRRRGWVTGGK